MKKIFLTAFLFLFLINLSSATIVMNTQLNDVYNLDDTITIPIKIATTTYLPNAKVSAKLICNGQETEVYSEYFTLEAGEERQREPSIPLIKALLGRTTGTCKIKLTLGNDEPVLSKEFEISDKITITPKISQTAFSPGENLIIEGDAIKANGKTAKGFVEISANILNNSQSMTKTDTIKNGYFYIEIPLEKNAKAGDYTVGINVYETDSAGEKTNKGYVAGKFTILQVPTSLEIVFENEEVEPGTNVKAKTILHDQSGEKINSISIVTIKNNKDEILSQTEKSTDEYIEYLIPYNYPPEEWTVVAVSNKLNAVETFKIKEKEDIEIKLINSTLTIKNIGNIIYNDSLLVKIGEGHVRINLTLNIDEEQQFTLTAPKGKYEVAIMANGKNTMTQNNVLLTGKSIDVKEMSDGFITIIRHPIVWVFIVGVFGFVIFIFLKKGYQKSIFGYIKSKKKHETKLKEHKNAFDSLLNFKRTQEKTLLENYSNRAELSLSIKGTKQDANIICLKIKNFEEIEPSTIRETMKKIVDISENIKSVVYENQGSILFIFAPSKTRTFKGEMLSVDLAQRIKKILDNHNKIFKQRIEFGISITKGAIIAKSEKSSFQFMSLGAIINMSKKIASISNEEILLDEKTKEKMPREVRTEKSEINRIPIYRITEIKKLEDNKKFLDSFVERMRAEKRK